jgi:hypothetical protein
MYNMYGKIEVLLNIYKKEGKVMKKKTLLSLFLTLSLTISTSLVGTIFVQADGLSADQLYNNAYNFTKTAMSTGTQVDINTARSAISALKGTGAEWAIGQFSQQVDGVQQPILVKIIVAIDKAKANPCQANVNIAKVSIPNELTPDWKNSYSSAVDAIEQVLINYAVNAYNIASISKSTTDITNAENIINDILTSTDSNTIQWATSYKTKIDAVRTASGVSIVNIPTGVTATAVSSGEIHIQWNPVEGADYYHLYYSDNEYDTYQLLINNLGSADFSWYSNIPATITNIPSSKTIYFKVTSVKNNIESDYSNVVSATTFSSTITIPDTIESTIDGEFEGWTGDTIFKLSNGEIWEQSSYAYTYHYAYMPKVLIYKSNELYKMKVDGVDKTIYVTRIKPTTPSSTITTPDTIESTIDGEFEGWTGDTIFKLSNGEIWEQSSYAYTYHYAYMPKVLIYKSNELYKMKVDGVDKTIYVTKIK